MPNGIPCRVTIGNHGVYIPEAARQKATEHLLEMSQGINPNTKKIIYEKIPHRIISIKKNPFFNRYLSPKF